MSVQNLESGPESQLKIKFIHSLKGKLLLLFLGLSLIPLGFVSILSYWQNQLAFQQRINDAFENSTILQVQGIEQWIAERKDDVVTVSEANRVQSMDREQVGQALQEFYDRWGIYQNMFVLTPDGERLFDTSGATSNLADREYFKRAMQGEVVVSDILISRVSGEPIIVFAAPVIANGDVVGVAGTVIRTIYITTLLEQIWVGDTGDAYLINQEGYFITEPRFSDQLKQAGLVEENPILEMQVDTVGAREALTGKAAVDQYLNYRGQSVLGAYRYLEDLKWGLLLEQDIAEAFAPITQQRNLVLIITIMSAGVIGGVALWIANSLTKSVTKITQAAQAVTQGNLEVKAEVESKDETSILAQAFNTMTERLNNLIDTLEVRVQERTRALEASIEISRQTSTILDLDELLQQVVTSIQDTFGYYHVHIYLLEEKTGELIMREGTGKVGRQLKAQGHKLRSGQGIVGNVAKRGEPFLAENVDEVPGFFRNPLLPKTQAELAVPLRKGEIIFGVLDMQSEETGGFSQEDLTLMQSIADQVAVAIDNARLFQQAQITAVEAEALARRLTREVWRGIGDKVETTGYVFTKSGVTAAPTEWLPVMAEATQQKKLAYYVDDGNEGQTEGQTQARPASLAIPLTLRGEVIGTIGVERPPDSPWTEDELTTIRTVTEQVSLALDAARLARETERSAWRDQVVSESTARVWSSAQIEEVMKAAVAQLGDKLRASEVVIRLGTEAELVQDTES